MTFEARFENEAAADSRVAQRRTLRLGASGQFARAAVAVTVHNISATGMMIQTETPLAEGERFALDLPEAGERSAQVVWADAPMYGCRFNRPLEAAALSAAQLRADVAESPEPVSPGEDFGARLHRLRVERGLSLADIGTRLGVSKPTVWAWEHGKSRPVEKRLAGLAQALGVTPGGLEPAPSGPPEVLERSRRQIAEAWGVEARQVRIMIEL